MTPAAGMTIIAAGAPLTDIFHQVYNPVGGNVLLSALVASLPPILLALMLAVLRVAPWRSAIAGAAAAFVLAWLVWGMPLSLTVAAATHGMAYGLWPISWIVVSAVFFYNLSVESGDFDVIRRSLSRLTGDRRIQVLLVAFCFGALIEGIAGFGAPVAITAAMMAGLGFNPIMAAVLALLANTAPVAFGSLGIPVTTLGGLLAPMLGSDTQTTTRALSAMVGRQLPFFSLLIPAYLVVIFAGWKRMTEVWPAVLVAGLTFAIGQFLVSNFVGPELTDTLAALLSLASVALLLKVWRPAEEYTGGGAPAVGACRVRRTPAGESRARTRRTGFWSSPCSSASPATSPGCRTCRRPRTSRRSCGAARAATGCVPIRGWARLLRSIRRPSAFPCGSSAGPAPIGWWTASRRPSCSANRRWRQRPSPYALTYRLDFLATAGTLVLLRRAHSRSCRCSSAAPSRRPCRARLARPCASCDCRS